jgi:hypothetical protein
MLTRSINRTNRYSTASNRRNRRKAALQGGFAAVTSVLLISFGVLAMSLAALGAAAMYADSVSARESRIQNALNQQACQDSQALIREKDAFVSGTIDMPEFGCSLSF